MSINSTIDRIWSNFFLKKYHFEKIKLMFKVSMSFSFFKYKFIMMKEFFLYRIFYKKKKLIQKYNVIKYDEWIR